LAFCGFFDAVRDVRVENLSPLTLSGLELTVEASPAFFRPRSVSIVTLEPGKSVTVGLDLLGPEYDWSLLASLVSPAAAAVTARVFRAGEELCRLKRQVTLLPPWQWQGLEKYPETLAHHVRPGAPAPLAAKAGALFCGGEGASGARADRDLRRRAAAAAWEAVRGAGIEVADPLGEPGGSGGPILSPEEALGRALCSSLDMGILLASLLSGLGPEVLLAFAVDALYAGAWLAPQRPARAWTTDKEFFLEALWRGELALLDVSLASSAVFGLGFAEAAELSAERFRRPGFLGALDVSLALAERSARKGARRPPPGFSPSAACPACQPDQPPRKPPDLIVLPPAAFSPQAATGAWWALPQGPSPAETPEERRRSRLRRWQDELLDLTLRNGLINYRQGSSHVDLLPFSPVWLAAKLCEGASFALSSGPEALKARPELLLRLDGPPRDRLEAMRCLAEESLGGGAILCGHDPGELERRLLALWRKSRSDLREGGVNTLYAAFLRLRYVPARRRAAGKEAGQEGRGFREAPLVLVPASLARPAANGGPWSVSRLGEEPRFNLPLLEALRRDYGLKGLGPLSDGFPDGLSGPDIVGAVKAFAKSVSESGLGWSISYVASLGLFPFYKHLMWRDLGELERLGRLSANAAVAALSGAHAPPAPSPPNPEDLDRILHPKDDLSPLPADSSQLVAAAHAAAGRSFPLIGPPGTGKSQTIANIIAQAIGDGKRVLFVAEKAAALEVVHRRLKEAGLSDLCLELHSNKANKKDVVLRLAQSLEEGKREARLNAEARTEASAGRKPGEAGLYPASWEALSERIRLSRLNLNLYVSELHRPCPSGLTPYKAVEILLSERNAPEIPLEPPDPSLGFPEGEGGFPFGSPRALADLQDSLGRAEALLASAGALNGPPLFDPHGADRAPSLEEGLAEAAEGMASLAGRFGRHAAALEPLGISLGLRAVEEADGVERLGRAVLGALRSTREAAQDETARRAESAAEALERAARALEAMLDMLRQSRGRGGGAPGAGDFAKARARLEASLETLAASREIALSLGGLDQGSLDPEQFRTLFPLADDLQGASGPQGLSGEARELAAAALAEESGLRALEREAETALALARRYKETAEELGGAYDLKAAAEADLDEARLGWREASGLNIFAGLLSRDRRLRAFLTALPFVRGLPAAVRLDRLDFEADLDLLGFLKYLESEAAALGTLNRSFPDLAARLFSPDGGAPDRLALLTGLIPGLAALAEAPERFRKAAANLFQAALPEKPDFSGILDFCMAGGWCGELASALAAGLGPVKPPDGPAQACGAAEGPGLRAFPQGLERFFRDFPDEARRFGEHMKSFYGPLGRPDLGPGRSLAAAFEEARSFLAGRNQFRKRPEYAKAAREARRRGLGSFIDALETGAFKATEAAPEEPNRLQGALRRAVAGLFLRCAEKGRRRLRRFTSEGQEWSAARFRELHRSKASASEAEIRARVRGPGFLQAVSEGRLESEVKVLEGEAKKGAGRLPVRRLLSSLPNLAPLLRPCLLMSPLSVAQYLPADGPLFDLVIFDEASQIPACDAIGAAARGSAVVAAGDRKQLPPTPFFKRAHEAEAVDFDAGGEGTSADSGGSGECGTGGDFGQGPEGGDSGRSREGGEGRAAGPGKDPLRSVMDELLLAGLQPVELAWHYRSRSESLIGFSNARYYGDRLATFPSPETRDSAVSFRHVAGGVYRPGGKEGNGGNKVEAQAVADEAISILKANAGRDVPLSVGVVTFNAPQQALVEDRLEEARRGNPALEPFFDDLSAEPVMVKSIENIQGDERDVILFSVGFGHQKDGSFPCNFGALNKDGGERRLNVAITRARRALKVFASFLPAQMPEGSVSRGFNDLKEFIEYASLGAGPGRREAAPAPGSFADAVTRALAARGWDARISPGLTGRGPDLCVADRDDPARYLAGVLCDGPGYRDAATALDRDCLREGVLRGLGWEMLRAWAPAWKNDPEGE
ncbi:MAG: DUF4011 domain-containing protein, partial [Deltaproteobacteria bacterium]|nr:DUF4011 domain-containing protein [Deltaproteobacteria bacterium]